MGCGSSVPQGAGDRPIEPANLQVDNNTGLNSLSPSIQNQSSQNNSGTSNQSSKTASFLPPINFKPLPSPIHANEKSKDGDKKVRTLVIKLHALATEPDNDALVWPICDLISNYSHFVESMEEAAKKSDSQWILKTVCGLLVCLQHCLYDSLTSAQKIAADCEPDVTWGEDMKQLLSDSLINGLLKLDARAQSNNVRIDGTLLIPDLISLLFQLEAVAMKERSVPQSVFKAPALNHCLRLLCTASWRGDSLSGGNVSESAGLPKWLFKVFSESLHLSESCMVLLDGPSKMFLLHRSLMYALAEGEQTVKKTTLTVTRELAMEHALQALMPVQARAPLATILNPYYRSAAGGWTG